MRTELSLVIIVVLAMVSTSCATLAPSGDRKVQYVDQTTANRDQAYNRALAYFGKSFGDANAAIQVRNPSDGQIVAKANVKCNIFRQFGDVNDYFLNFDLDFQAKDKRARILFENLEMKGAAGTTLTFETNQISSKEKAEKAKECLEPIHAGLLGAISGAGKTDW